MKFSELKKMMIDYKEVPHRDDYDVVIPLATPSIGSQECVNVSGVNFGIDWDNGKFFIIPSKKIVVKSEAEDILDAARDLIFHLATVKSKRKSYETGEAQRILKRFGYTDKYFEDTTSYVNKDWKPAKD